MNTDNDPAHETPIFSAMLTPHRSLRRGGFLLVMLALGGVSFAAGIMFLLAGAWPVFGFFGLDVLLVYAAFRLNYRAARAYEEVTITASELIVRKVSARGHVREWNFNPLWVRLERSVHAHFGLERLSLVSHGQQVPIATFLGGDEKQSFAQALALALGEAKRGPTRTVF